LAQHADWRGIATFGTYSKKFAGLAGRFRADVRQLLIVICYRLKPAEQC
jgi:hypothetical protein